MGCWTLRGSQPQLENLCSKARVHFHPGRGWADFPLDAVISLLVESLGISHLTACLVQGQRLYDGH